MIENQNILVSFFNVWISVLRNPKKFFMALKVTGLKDPLIFFCILTLLQIIMSIVFTPKQNFIMVISQFLFLYAYNLTMLFVMSGVIHIFVSLFGGRSGFKATFTAMAYANAAMIFLIIPYVGSVIFAILSIIISCVGIKYLHEISMGKSVASVLLPSFILAFVIAIVVAIQTYSQRALQTRVEEAGKILGTLDVPREVDQEDVSGDDGSFSSSRHGSYSPDDADGRAIIDEKGESFRIEFQDRRTTNLLRQFRE